MGPGLARTDNVGYDDEAGAASGSETSRCDAAGLAARLPGTAWQQGGVLFAG